MASLIHNMGVHRKDVPFHDFGLLCVNVMPNLQKHNDIKVFGRKRQRSEGFNFSCFTRKTLDNVFTSDFVFWHSQFTVNHSDLRLADRVLSRFFNLGMNPKLIFR